MVLMNKIISIVLGLFLIAFFVSGAYAGTVTIDNEVLELRGSGNYDNAITAEDNDYIDIKITFDITDIDGNGLASNISTRAKIYRWDSNDDWVYWRTTTTKSQTMEEDSFVFTWTNDFQVNDNYERYKIEGEILEGSNILEIMDAYIDVVDNSCSGINLVAYDFDIDEGNTQTKIFRVENNTDADFTITNADVYFTTNGIKQGNVDYSTIVQDHTTEEVNVELEADYVSTDRTITGTFKVEGNLGSTFCSYSDIGYEIFDVKIDDTGSNSNPGTSGDCDDLEIKTRDIEVNENNTAMNIFYIENNSTKRFEVLDVKIIENGVEADSYYFEKYAFPGNIADLVIITTAPNVTQDRVFENKIQVRGRFSDGKTCNYDDIDEKTFNVSVINSSGASFATCNGLSISVQETATITNSGQIPFTITNATNKTATIFVESNVSVSPTSIILPEGTSISRTLNVEMTQSEGEIILRPVVDGCNVSSKRITVYNNASGDIENLQLNARMNIGVNTNSLIIEFNNPTNKIFTGVLSFEIEGETINDMVITIVPGYSFAEVELSKPSAKGRVIFSSQGRQIEANIDTNEGNLAGFFLLNLPTIGIGLVLLIIVIVIVAVIVYVTDNTRRVKEIWETSE